MNNNEMLKVIHEETLSFFNNIFTSNEMQAEYDLIKYPNRDFVLNIINEFKDSPNACIVKPFYEVNYSDSSVPRSIMVRRDKYGFITSQLYGTNTEPSIIEPFRFVSIIKQLIEDETIKKEMYSENEKEQDYEIEK